MILPFVIHIPLLIAIIFYHSKRQASSELKTIYWLALFLKLAAGIFIGVLYTHYYPYGGDTFIYQDFSVKLNQLAKENFNHYLQFVFLDRYDVFGNTFYDFYGQPRVLFMFKLLSPLNFFTLNNYWLNALYLSLFSFICLWRLGVYLEKQYSIKSSSIAVGFFCFPTFVVWSSGVLKESIIIGILCLLIYFFLRTINEKKISLITFIISLILLYIGWQLKFFYIAILLFSMAIYALTLFLYTLTLLYSPIKKTIALLFGLLVSAFISLLIIPHSYFNYILEIMQISYSNMILYSHPGTYFTFDGLKSTIGSYLAHSPEALATGLFRPFIWEVSGILTLCESLENIFIIALFLACVYQFVARTKIKISPELFSLIIYIIISAILMAFIGPNWGTLSRYKVSFQFLWVMLLWENAFPGPVKWTFNQKDRTSLKNE